MPRGVSRERTVGVLWAVGGPGGGEAAGVQCRVAAAQLGEHSPRRPPRIREARHAGVTPVRRREGEGGITCAPRVYVIQPFISLQHFRDYIQQQRASTKVVYVSVYVWLHRPCVLCSKLPQVQVHII